MASTTSLRNGVKPSMRHVGVKSGAWPPKGGSRKMRSDGALAVETGTRRRGSLMPAFAVCGNRLGTFRGVRGKGAKACLRN